ncbi:MAG: hypothetical protein OXB92_16670 [Acidimicrobiaceae bacterium]|nr:hypothetical protein [Acidimicrobiaceae bacterium]
MSNTIKDFKKFQYKELKEDLEQKVGILEAAITDPYHLRNVDFLDLPKITLSTDLDYIYKLVDQKIYHLLREIDDITEKERLLTLSADDLYNHETTELILKKKRLLHHLKNYDSLTRVQVKYIKEIIYGYQSDGFADLSLADQITTLETEIATLEA